MSVPAGFWYLRSERHIPPDGQCYEIAVYENGKGEKWANRHPISRGEATADGRSPFFGWRR